MIRQRSCLSLATVLAHVRLPEFPTSGSASEIVKMTDFTINELLERRGIDQSGTRLVRHDLRALAEWRQGPAFFDHFVSYQRDDSRTPYNNADVAVQFVPHGSTGAMFVGVHNILDEWQAGEKTARDPALFHPGSSYADWDWSHRRYDLKRRPELEDLVGRVVIEWGASTRSWSQWASNAKPIVELRATAHDDPFPGFGDFSSTVDELLLLPMSWQNALASVGGVYLLVCPDTGEQYVGSAYGDGGFMNRWNSYVVNGHGGNVKLAARPRTNFAVSILEIASPQMSASEIIGREKAWKAKLGTRSHGLNAN